jgi:glycosyltransferase involved in cell wall biosynthesis
VKVLHVTDDLSLLGGVQRYLETLGEALPEHGVESRLWSPRPGALGGAASRWYGRRFRRRLGHLIAEEHPDLVHAHNLWMRLSPLPLAAAAEAGVPVVMTAHDYAWICPRKWMITADDRPCVVGFGARCAVAGCRGSKEGAVWVPYNALRWLKTGWQRRMLVRWVDRFISPSRHLAGWMERSLGVAPVLHIPNFALPPGTGVRVAVDRPSSLLFAGRLSREKGVELLLEAVAEVVNLRRKVELVIAGDGPRRAALERMTSELAIDGVVDFVGSVGPDRLSRLYASSALVVLPTLWMENCPVSVLEAFAHGRAVVATRIGGVPELVVDGVTGALFERGDVHGLARRLTELLDEPELVSAMGRRAAEAWAAEYTVERHCARLRDLYTEVAAG